MGNKGVKTVGDTKAHSAWVANPSEGSYRVFVEPCGERSDALLGS